MAEAGDLQAIAMIGDRLDGKPKQMTDVTLRTAAARELSDDDLAAIVVGAEPQEIEENPKADPTEAELIGEISAFWRSLPIYKPYQGT